MSVRARAGRAARRCASAGASVALALVALVAPVACTAADDGACAADAAADVTAVSTSGAGGHYVFRVTVASPDRGCGCYADFWEVVGLDGHLIERRLLEHPHVEEQPFSREGGEVTISEDLYVVVRAHMASVDGDPADGYGGQVMRGSVRDGFVAAAADADFATTLATADPQPPACAAP